MRTMHSEFDSTASSRGWLVAGVVGVTLLGATLRAVNLNHPMRYDESVTYFSYVNRSLPDLLTCYDQVQNHILHTAMQHELVRWLPPTPPVLRLPAFVAGVALIPLGAVLAFMISRRALFALLAGAAVAASTVLIDFATNARGYSLVCALTLGMAVCTVAWLRSSGRKRYWLIWSVLGALGAFTVPIMVFPVAGFALLVLVDAVLRRRRGQLLQLAMACGLCGVLVVLMYLPAVKRLGVGGLARSQEQVYTFSKNAIGSYADMARTLWEHWTLDLSVVALVVASVGVLIAAGRAIRTRNVVWAMPLVLAAAAIAAAQALPITPYPRVWIFLLPIVLTFGACGWAALGRPRIERIVAAALAVGLVHSAYRASQREYFVAEDPHTLIDAERVAEALADQPNRTFAVITLPSTDAIRYYAHLHDLPRSGHPSDPKVTDAFVVVNRTQTLDELLHARGEYLAEYDEPQVFRTLAHAKIYRLSRRGEAAGVATEGARSIRHWPAVAAPQPVADKSSSR